MARRAQWRTLQARPRWCLLREQARAGAPGDNCSATGQGCDAPPHPKNQEEQQQGQHVGLGSGFPQTDGLLASVDWIQSLRAVTRA
jgi:hypothetical protein